jgi:hypothetical protein
MKAVASHRQIPGFFTDADYAAVEQIVGMLPPDGTLIEVGCLMGRSTTAWAEALRGSGRRFEVHAIDTFAASFRNYAEYLEGDPALIQEVLETSRSQEELFVEFTRAYSNITYSKTPFSTSFAWDKPVHCVFEDSDHAANTLAQALPFWWAMLEPGGVLSGHDYDKDCPDVIQEVDRFVRALDTRVTLYPGSSFWSCRKPAAAPARDVKAC